MNHFRNCFLVLVISSVTVLHAQSPLTIPVQDISYRYLQNSGTNASVVTWLPAQQIYISAIAGNDEYPLEGFNSTGQNVFIDTCHVDIRGMWWNPANNQVETNNAGEIGWSAFKIENNRATYPQTIFTGQLQPDFQSVGAYDEKNKKVIFLDIPNGGIKLYKRSKPKKTSTVELYWGTVSPSNINMYSIGYTGHSGYEYVLLDYVNRNLIFFDDDGKLTATISLPANAPVNDTFAFSFTNNRAFLYDKESRIWFGYKVF